MKQYSDIINIMRAQATGSCVHTGIVAAVSPLVLYINGAEVSTDLFVPPHMLSTEPISDYELSEFAESVRLDIGDEVVVLSGDEGFYVIAKVVEA